MYNARKTSECLILNINDTVLNKYKIGEQFYVVIDDQLFQAVEALADLGTPSEQPAAIGAQHTRPSESKGKGKRLTPDEIERMAQDRQNGMNIGQLMKKYGVSYPTIYNRLKEHDGKKKTGSGNRIQYECANRHQFVSDLPIGSALCPDCHTRDISVYKEPSLKD